MRCDDIAEAVAGDLRRYWVANGDGFTLTCESSLCRTGNMLVDSGTQRA